MHMLKDVQYIYGYLFARLDARDPAEEGECLFPEGGPHLYPHTYLGIYELPPAAFPHCLPLPSNFSK